MERPRKSKACVLRPCAGGEGREHLGRADPDGPSAIRSRPTSRTDRTQSAVLIAPAHASVSSHDQKDDPTRQVALLESFCAANGWTFETLRIPVLA